MASLRFVAAVLLPGALVAAIATPLDAQIFPARQYKTPIVVGSMDTGDLDRDGLTDVVCGTQYQGIVAVLLRDEAGGFLPFTTLAVDALSRAVALGDLNGDGLLDLVSSDAFESSLSIRLGHGNGGFGPLAVHRGVKLDQLLLADLDGDGDDDVAGCSTYGDAVQVLLSDDAGVPIMSGAYAVGHMPRSIAVADFDLDGDLDLLTGNAGAPTMSLLLGDGAGSFVHAIALPAPGQVNSAIAGDVDEDGDPDVIAVTTSGALLDLGNGDGTFTASPGFTVAGVPGLFPVLADADGDGFLDLISHGLDGYFVQLGRLGPGFEPPLGPIILGELDAVFSRVALLEADGDGWPDLVVGGAGQGANHVSVLPGLGFGVFQSCERVTVTGDSTSMALADVDGDQDVDAAIACYGYFTGAGVSVLLNDGAGDFVPSSHPATTSVRGIAAGDIDADGDVDLVALVYSTLQLFLGDGSGAFPPPTSFELFPELYFVRLGDFDGDGADDVAAAYGSGSSAAIAVALADGAGSFGTPVSYSLGGATPTALELGDVDLDGDLDLVVNSKPSDKTAVLLGDGAGGFSSPAFMPVPDAPTGIAIVDATADGLPDLVSGHTAVGLADPVMVHAGDGAGGFGPPQPWPSGNEPGRMAVADVNADGVPDLVVSESLQGGAVVLLLGQAGGGFEPPRAYAAGYWPSDLGVADIDGDGRTDVLSLDLDKGLASSTISVLRNLGPPEPWSNLGLGLAGPDGIPMLVGHGTLQPGEPASLTLHGGNPASPAILVIGFAPLFAPFKGGVLVPRPHLFIGGLATDLTGSLDLQADWPSGVPAAVPIWYQEWIVDPGAVAGLAGSNGVTSITP